MSGDILDKLKSKHVFFFKIDNDNIYSPYYFTIYENIDTITKSHHILHSLEGNTSNKAFKF